MEVSQKVLELPPSVTLALNAKAVALQNEGKKVLNLTAGQLPFKPHNNFVEEIQAQLSFLKSFQYSPAGGFSELSKKILESFSSSRGIDFGCDDLCEESFSSVISNGGKHSLYNIFGSMLNPGDEVILMAPYWLTYPAMVNMWEGKSKVVHSHLYNNFEPEISDIEKQINSKTKVIVINSPNNPTGVHYSSDWMKDFAELMLKYPHVNIISDEIYYELYYYDPKPTYFYQFAPSLLKRTVVLDGISKTMASTGLRIGHIIAPENFCKAVAKLQGQTTSGPNSLIQRAMEYFDWTKKDEFLTPVRDHLRTNAQLVQEKLRKAGLDTSWYQTRSAFYYLVDFSKMPFFTELRKKSEKEDFASLICETILDQIGVALVPTTDFGMPNCARMSLVLDHSIFEVALDKLIDFFIQGKV